MVRLGRSGVEERTKIALRYHAAWINSFVLPRISPLSESRTFLYLQVLYVLGIPTQACSYGKRMHLCSSIPIMNVFDIDVTTRCYERKASRSLVMPRNHVWATRRLSTEQSSPGAYWVIGKGGRLVRIKKKFCGFIILPSRRSGPSKIFVRVAELRRPRVLI